MGIRLETFGRDISKAANLHEAMVLADLNWEVRTGPVQTLIGDRLIELPDYKTIVRADNMTPLGVVGKGYKPFQNAEALGIVDDLMKEGGAKMMRAGLFGGGGATFFSMELPGRMKIGPKSDEVAKYLTIINSHDGSHLFRSLFAPFRIWCSNQIRALLEKFKDNLSIRHTKNGWNKLEEARSQLGAANVYYKQFEQLADKLARTNFSAKQMKELADTVFPKQKGDDGKEELSGKAENSHAKVIELFETGAGHRESGLVGTAWGAVNAVAEWVDFERNTRTFNGADTDATRSQAAWFGSGTTIKQASFDTVRSMVGLA